MRRSVAVLAALVFLAAVNFTIHAREKMLQHGRVVLLELAPVDPRSLMQGDYMALRFKVATDAFAGADLKQLKDGRLVVALDRRGVASFRRFADAAALAADETLLRYRIRDAKPKFATNAFFFQEGQARQYESARYGEFRVANDGEMILTGLRGADLALLGTAP